MTTLIVRRLLLALPLLLVVSFITFALQAFIPGDPALSLLGPSATADQLATLRAQLHLDQPILTQYGIYLSGLIHGDLGRSIFTGQAVVTTLAERLPVSLSLIVATTVVALLVGTGLGVLSATRGRIIGRITDVVTLLGASLPNFWVGLVLVSMFAVAVTWFPATGYVPFSIAPGQWALSLVLPVVALALGSIAMVAKVIRDGVATALSMDYMRTLRAAGLPEGVLIWKHALRSSAVSLVTVLGVIFVGALSGTVLVENVFVLPGLGSLAVSATARQDLPVIQGVALAFTVITIVVNLVIDISYGLLNPKVRAS